MLLIFASEAAAFIGKNPYKAQWDAFERVWARVRPEQYEAQCEEQQAHDSNAAAAAAVHAALAKVQTDAVAAAAAHTQCAHADATVERVQAAERQVVQAVQAHAVNEATARVMQAAAALDVPTVDASNASASMQTLRALATEKGNEAALALLQQAEAFTSKTVEFQKQAASDVRCAFGTVKEAGSRDQFVKTTGVAVAHDNKFHKLRLGTMPYSREAWGIGGRLDGLDAQGRVVEIKNRTRRFFDDIPEYERVQTLCYMKMLKTRRAVIVQQFRGKHRYTDVELHDADWAACLHLLTAAMHVLDLFVSDDNVVLRRAWVSSMPEGKQGLLTRWLSEMVDAAADAAADGGDCSGGSEKL